MQDIIKELSNKHQVKFNDSAGIERLHVTPDDNMLIETDQSTRLYTIGHLLRVDTASERTEKQIELSQIVNFTEHQEFERKVLICIDHLPSENPEAVTAIKSVITEDREWDSARREALKRLSKSD